MAARRPHHARVVGIARHKLVDVLRRRHRYVEIFTEDLVSGSDISIEDSIPATRSELEALVQRLPFRQGNPVLDAEGRFIPTGEFTAIFVMEKEEGWGEAIGLEVTRNGDWDYARFNVDGTLRADTDTTGCFGCHAAT